MTLFLTRVLLIVLLNQRLTHGASRVKRALPSDIVDEIKNYNETKEVNEENVTKTSSGSATKTILTASPKKDDKNHTLSATESTTEVATKVVTTRKKEDIALSPNTTEKSAENVTKTFTAAFSDINDLNDSLNSTENDGTETVKILESDYSGNDIDDNEEDYFPLSDGDYYYYYYYYGTDDEIVETTTLFTLPVFIKRPATDALKVIDKLKNIKHINPAVYVTISVIFVCFFISSSIALFIFLKTFCPTYFVQEEQNEYETDEKNISVL